MTTAILTARAASLLEAAEAMIGLLRDHTEELASGEAYDELAIDAYTELQVSAQALRLHFDSPNTDADSPDKPEDMEQKLWDAIQGEAGHAVFEAITQQRRASTNALCEITGFARTTVSRVLCAYQKLGKVRCLGQANGQAPKEWEIVE